MVFVVSIQVLVLQFRVLSILASSYMQTQVHKTHTCTLETDGAGGLQLPCHSYCIEKKQSLKLFFKLCLCVHAWGGVCMCQTLRVKVRDNIVVCPVTIKIKLK